jgi:hypothetical protein
MIAAVLLLSLLQAYRPEWKGFPEGSIAEYRSLLIVGGKEVEAFQRLTLKRAASDGALIETLTEGEFGMVPAKQERVERFPAQPERAGEETLLVEGRPYACTIWSWKGADRSVKTWEHAELKPPGGAIKVEQRLAGEVVVGSRLVQVRDAVTLGGRTWDCAVFDTETKAPDHAIKGRAWLNEKVPGFAVRTLTRLERKGAVAELRMELSGR